MPFVIAIVMIVVFFLLTARANRVPKTGRDAEANGERITAVITNRNKSAEKAVWLRAVSKDGRKFKVKMKASEAKYWIKGDEISILISKENPKKYRVLFNDYFRENEARIREEVIKHLEKNVKKRLAARFVGYSDKTLRAFKMCSVDTHNIFMFTTFMRMIDFYSIVTIVMIASFIGWFITKAPTMGVMFVPLAAVLILVMLLKGSIDFCKRIKDEVIKSAKINKAKQLSEK